MPYGICTGRRVLPPSRVHFARILDAICENLISSNSKDVTGIINNLLSIRENQVRELLLNEKDIHFQFYGVDEKMCEISQMINMHLACLLSNTKTE